MIRITFLIRTRLFDLIILDHFRREKSCEGSIRSLLSIVSYGLFITGTHNIVICLAFYKL